MTNQRYYVIPTNELRWIRGAGNFLIGAGEALPKLQQKWMQYELNKDGVLIETTGTIQWRDVPFVEEESDEK